MCCCFFLREFTLDVSLEMPYEISSLKCITHEVKTKVICVFHIYPILII